MDKALTSLMNDVGEIRFINNCTIEEHNGNVCVRLFNRRFNGPTLKDACERAAEHVKQLPAILAANEAAPPDTPAEPDPPAEEETDSSEEEAVDA